LCLILINKSPTEGYNVKINVASYNSNSLTNFLDKSDKVEIVNDELNIYIKPLEGKLYINNLI